MRDEDFFYEGAERGDLLDALNGHAHESATVVLEGETGSGVSTLLGMLSMSLVGDYELIRLDGAEEPGANAVVDAMLVHFGIERAELADTLKQTLANSRLVIVVDNAESMPQPALATMASLKEKLGQRLAYVFGGAPGSTEMVREGGLAVVDTLSLPPLDGDDVMAMADEFFALSLDQEQADDIVDSAQGRLGPVLADLEERASSTAGPAARKPVPWRHALAVGALVLVVLVLWLASGDDEDSDRADKVVNLELPRAPADTLEAEPAESAAGELAPRTGEDGHDYGLVSDPERSRDALAEFHDNASDFEQAETRPRDTGQPASEGAGPVPPAEPDTSRPASSADTSSSSTAARPAQKPAPEPASKPAPEPAPKPAQKPARQPAASEQAVPGGQPELSGLDARLGYRQEDWLATRGDDQWFLQLVATGREDGARAVLDQIGREGAYYRTERGGEQVYLVLAGPYTSRDAALKAREGLPEALRRGGPFPREMGAIRKELR
ncbi:SPOR domain-containing protein [Alloalcanivorax gelatiniphagus]|uniref:SPOR domain-containing protein n=1 Tax=Alloalcanivorax gelatiniphagus TaxID=1194167 RepID=A0ABY2XIX0_9GAMM|nr:SPOR domain-containing protein [Alloalcanivorax gelatiniphagus]TMW11842.1 hypothetical protein FGS76_12480 [Alloalcanivorax gelatiniphagus]